jgi:hypothetical protein
MQDQPINQPGAGSDSSPQDAAASGDRGRSTIEFAYFDLDSGREIAQAIRDVGATSCEPASLATKLNMAPDGGGFRMRLLGAKVYGLIAYGRGSGGAVELTELGRQIVDPQTQRKARLDAFMSVPLNKALFERLKGQVMPPPSAMERLIESMGVAPKQKDKARQVFMRSAKQAGLFELSSERLTLPPIANGTPTDENAEGQKQKQQDSSRQRGDHEGGDGKHPFIRGLIDTLPEPDSAWSKAARAKWLTTAANIFDLIYEDPDPNGLTIVLKGSTLTISSGD